jgi:nicotinamidase-related amidase
VLKADQAVLVVVDVQGKLAQLMHEKEVLFRNLSQMIRGARVLGIPVIWMEQNPDGLGPTVPEVAGVMPEGLRPIPKFSFSCCGEPRFVAALEAAGRRQVLLCGIEAHICVYQTARDLVTNGYEVFVVADAVSSRKSSSRDVALMQLGRSEARLTTVEMALFEMLGAAKGPEFKEIVRIVK